MVVDREGIQARLRRLDECVRMLRRLRPSSLQEYSGDRPTGAACERELRIAVQCALDIGNHLIAEENLEPPEELRDIFPILGRAGILPRDFSARKAPMAGMRNILVHDYLRIEHAKVFAGLTHGLDDLDESARHVQAWLDRKP